MTHPEEATKAPEASDRKRIFLVDAYSLLYRAHFAFIKNPLITSKGLNTSALFGFVNMLLGLIEREHPDYMAVAFDKSEKTFRHDIFPEYKGTREKTPDELVAQFPFARDVVEALGLPVVEADDFEADDLLGAMAVSLASRDVHAVIVTGDRDSLQLVGPNVSVMMTRKGISETLLYDPAVVKENLGVEPSGVVDLKALMGDTSDNIPGVPGVGEKTAVKLLSEHGDLDALYSNLDAVKGKLREKLEQNRDKAYMSRELARIRTDLACPVSLQDCLPRVRDRDKLRKLFLDLEMRKFAAMIEPDAAGGETTERQYVTVLSAAQLDELLAVLRGAEIISLDTETTSPEPTRAELVGLSFAVKEGQAWYLPVGHVYLGAPEQLDRKLVLERLGEVLSAPGKKIVGQNLKYDVMVLERAGMVSFPVHFDTMIADYLLNPGRMQRNMDLLALEYLGIKPIAYSEVVPKDKTFAEIELARATEYAAEDADVALRLWRKLEQRLRDEDLLELFHRVEMPLLPVLARMELNGITIDPDYLGGLSKELTHDIRRLEGDIHRLAGEEFNVSSNQQLARILFEKLGLPTVKKTKTGYSTDASVLEELEKTHGSEIAALINEYRHLVKLRGTYVDTLPKLIHPRTHRIHTSFSQVTAATGRLSSSDPNLQNIPIRTEVGARIRKAFRADPPGWKLLGADYSQIELRVLAHVSGSPVLREAFRKGEDIHTQTASLLFSVEPELVDARMRNRAKSINFGVLYGMGPFGLASRLGIPQSEAKSFIASYFERLPEVKAYIETTIEQARRDGYVSTLLKRKRILPEIASSNANLRSFAERTAINTPIQGTAADLIKLAMIELHARMAREGFEARLLLQIHDELVCEAPPAEVDALGACMREVMESAMSLDVPLVANLSVGEDLSMLK